MNTKIGNENQVLSHVSGIFQGSYLDFYRSSVFCRIEEEERRRKEEEEKERQRLEDEARLQQQHQHQKQLQQE